LAVFASHIIGRPCRWKNDSHRPRLTRNHWSLMVRGHIVPQPSIVIGIIFRRKIIAFVRR